MSCLTRREFIERSLIVAGTAALLPTGEANAATAGMQSPILRRAFGRTGESVTFIGLGGGSRFYEPVPDDEQGAELVRQAIDAGVGVVETAANYGPDNASERRIGLAMATHRDRVFLETKIDARDYDGAMREMERSLKLLRTDRIDLILHHNLRPADDLDRILGSGGADQAIRRLVDQKVVHFRGFSCHYPELVRVAMDRFDPDGMQLPLNATRVPDFEKEVLPLASERGIGVVAMKTVGHGYFLPANTTRPDREDRYGAPAGVLARPDLPTAREYLHYALTLPIATAVVGMDSLATIRSILADVSAFRPMAEDERLALTKRAQVFSDTGYWIPQPRSG